MPLRHLIALMIDARALHRWRPPASRSEKTSVPRAFQLKERLLAEHARRNGAPAPSLAGMKAAAFRSMPSIFPLHDVKHPRDP
jgi:hypothetical protein